MNFKQILKRVDTERFLDTYELTRAFLGTIFITMVVLEFVCFASAATITQPNTKAPIDLIGCRDIEEPGSYRLTSDLSFGSDDEDYCIDIWSDNVILDGQGHSIRCRDNHQEDCSYAISATSSKNITIKNIIIYNIREGTGVELGNVNNATISGIQTSNLNEGIYLGAVNNTLLTGNYFYSGSPDNGWSDCIGMFSTKNVTVQGNVCQGHNYSIVIGQLNKNLKIYNNYLNSITKEITLYQTNGSEIYLSIPKTPGRNVIGGNYIGGNYWAKPNGRGFSQTCSDNNRDGFCDSCLGLGYGLYDLLPLTNHGPGPIQSLCNVANK